MKKALNYLGKTLVGFLFVALLAINIQVGKSDSFLTDKDLMVEKAKAGNCETGRDACSMYTYPDGTTYVEMGKVVVVTQKNKTIKIEE